MDSCLPFSLFSSYFPFLHLFVATLLPSVPQKDERYFFLFQSLSWLFSNPPDLCQKSSFSSFRFQIKCHFFREILPDNPAFGVICFQLQIKNRKKKKWFQSTSTWEPYAHVRESLEAGWVSGDWFHTSTSYFLFCTQLPYHHLPSKAGPLHVCSMAHGKSCQYVPC